MKIMAVLIYFTIIFLKKDGMPPKPKDGLKFSFGLRPLQQPSSSAFSTPKFPSIQISKDSKHNPFYSQHKSQRSTQRLQMTKTPSQIYKELGGGGIELIPRDKKLKLKMLDKFNPFITIDANSFQKYEKKSIKSAHLSNEKDVYKSQKKRELKLHYKNKNFHSLANILQTTGDSQLRKVTSRLAKNKHKNKTQTQVQNKTKLARTNIQEFINKPERKQTKKTLNNFFQISPKNMEMRQTKKQNKSLQKQSPNAQKQKSKIFKSYFQKARPTLRITGRLLTNQRLQNIVKDCQDDTNGF